MKHWTSDKLPELKKRKEIAKIIEPGVELVRIKLSDLSQGVCVCLSGSTDHMKNKPDRNKQRLM